MLLFIRNPYWQAIKDGLKRFEIRAGLRYSNLREGDWLSLNGKLRRQITAVETHRDPVAVELASQAAGYLVTAEQIRECYPTAREFYVLHFA